MSEALDQQDPLSTDSDLGLDSELSILISHGSLLNIDIENHTLSTLTDAIASLTGDPDSATSQKETLQTCSTLIASILFELESLKLTQLMDTPLRELQSYLLALPLPANTTDVADTSSPPTPESPQSESTINLSSELATTLWRVGDFFNNPNPLPSEIFPGEIPLRLAQLHWILACEMECSEKLQPILRAVWPLRSQVLRPWLAISGEKLTLATTAFELTKDLEKKHTPSLLTERIPTGTFVAMIRLILTSKAEFYRPDLQGAAMLYLFLGSPSLSKGRLSNLSGDECQLIAATLLNLHSRKRACINLFQTDTLTPQETARDCRSVIELVSQATEFFQD